MKELKHWDRACPVCQTVFGSVQEKGRCPNCKLLFCADRQGVVDHNSYEIRQRHPFWGDIFSPPAAKNAVRHWYSERFPKEGRDISIWGDNHGPYIDSSESILRIAQRYDDIKLVVIAYLKAHADTLRFVRHIDFGDFEFYDVAFYTEKDPRRYIASVGFDAERARHRPPAGCAAGNGWYHLMFVMSDMEVIGILGINYSFREDADGPRVAYSEAMGEVFRK